MWLKDNSKKESGVPAEIVRIGEKGAGAGWRAKVRRKADDRTGKYSYGENFREENFVPLAGFEPATFLPKGL